MSSPLLDNKILLPTLLVKGNLLLLDSAKMAKANRDIPINYIISWIKKRMPEYGYNKANLEDRILVVRAETGSGKSTVLPVEIFRILRNKDTSIAERYSGKSVICTQPRVLTTVALANDVSKRSWNPDIVLGKTVGYQTGPYSNKANSGLLFATAGVLTAQFENQTDEEIMEMYKFILVDEAHERSQDCDLLLMLLKNFYTRNKGNKNLPFMLLTSATFDIYKYTKYFNINAENNTVQITGRAYKIDTHWPNRAINNYVEESINTAKAIHENNHNDPDNKCDILIFVTGNKQINLIKEGLENINKQYEEKDSEYSPFIILTINRENINSQSADFNMMFIKLEYLPKVFDKVVKRRIIIATIVAETGLTVDTLKYVIDCGWHKTIEIYQPWGTIGLISRPAPMSRVQQRKGRVGRLFPGEFYPLYTEDIYNTLDEQQLPDFINMGIKDKFLSIVQNQQRMKISMKEFPDFKVEDIKLLDPPSMVSFIMANSLANLLGFVSENTALSKKWPPNFEKENIFGIEMGYGLTEIGHIAANIKSINMESIKMILLSCVYNTSVEDMINIAAIVSITDGIYHIDELKKKENTPAGTKILLDSIPNYKLLYEAILQGSDEKNLNIEHIYITLRLFFSDDFIELLFIFEKFIDIYSEPINNSTAESNSSDPNEDILNWCKTMGVEFKSLIFALVKRNEIIDDFYLAGIDPFKNEQFKIKKILSNLKNAKRENIPLLLNTIKSIKRCIYGGFFNNLLTLNPNDNAYYNNQSLRVKLNKPFVASKLIKLFNGYNEYKPKWIIAHSLELVANTSPDGKTPAPLLYTVQAKSISVLDGFIYPDFEFSMPKIDL